MEKKLVAYYSMEYAIEKDLPIYAGGLGVLAGDYLLEAGKLNSQEGLNYIFLGLFYGDHLQNEPGNSGFKLLKDENDEPIWLDIDIAIRPIFAQVWVKDYGTAKLYLFDTNVTSNETADKEITKSLYDSNNDVFLKQQLVLAIGSVKLFQRLNLNPSVHHLNEGHTALTIIALAIDFMDSHPQSNIAEALQQIKPIIVGTKHTILHAAGRDISRTDFERILGQYAQRHKQNLQELFELGVNHETTNTFSTMYLLMSNIRSANCVSKLHCDFEAGVHHKSPLIPITNGINRGHWEAKIWGNASLSLGDSDLWKIHQQNKNDMFKALNLDLDINNLTVVWARRLAFYKRPLLLFNDLSRLAKIINNPSQPLQIIIAGRPHPGDNESLQFAKELVKISRLPEFLDRFFFIPEYSLNVTAPLTSGADVWLNTPTVGIEACGTSGMKAGLNGGLVFSTRDGWTGEVDWKDTGWIVPEENVESNIYSILEEQIVPEYYNRQNELPDSWIQKMRQTMKIIQDKYTTKRMLKEYVEKLYFPMSSRA